jgi:hypothetical protein
MKVDSCYKLVDFNGQLAAFTTTYVDFGKHGSNGKATSDVGERSDKFSSCRVSYSEAGFCVAS